jgi:hypothetical protein
MTCKPVCCSVLKEERGLGRDVIIVWNGSGDV